MYAIIRTGGKQAKVREGDVLDVERLRAEGEVTFTPLLVVGDDGSVVSGRKNLESAKVVARVLGDSSGDKIDIFKYRAKTGYRRRQGHRQKYTTIEVTAIQVPGVAPAKKAKQAEAPESDEAAQPAEAAEPAKPAAKSTAKSSTAKSSTKSTAKSTSTKSTSKQSTSEEQ